MEAGDWRSGVSKDAPRAAPEAPSPFHPEFIEGRDGLSGLLRMRADGGAMAFETGSQRFFRNSSNQIASIIQLNN
jgi:hypothetical protein